MCAQAGKRTARRAVRRARSADTRAAARQGLLNTHQLEVGIRRTFNIKTQLYGFSHTLHQRVKTLGLRITPTQRRNRGHIITVFVPLDNNGKFLLRPHKSNSSEHSIKIEPVLNGTDPPADC